MLFLVPWVLLGIAALTVPIALHLWKKQETKTMRFPSLRLLKTIAATTRRRARFEHVLLLILRCALLACLVIAFAKPVIREAESLFFSPNQPRTVVLLVDNSMSMSLLTDTASRLEIAKQQASAVLGNLESGDLVAVLAVNSRTEEILPEPTMDQELAAGALAEIRPTFYASDFAPAFENISRIFSDSPPGWKQVFFFTDNQKSGWQSALGRADNLLAEHPDAEILLVLPDGAGGANTSIHEVKLQKPALQPGAGASTEVAIGGNPAVAGEDILQLEVNGLAAARELLDIPENGVFLAELGFVAPLTKDRLVSARTFVTEDRLPQDNRFFNILPVHQHGSSLIVARPTAISPRSSFFLEAALQSGGASPPSVIAPSDLPAANLSGISIIFFLDAWPLTDLEVVRLENFVRSGGVLAIFAGPSTRRETTENFPLLPVTLDEPVEAPEGRLATMIAQPTHALFLNVWGSSLPFPALPQKTLLPLALGNGAAPLLLLEEVPFLIQSNVAAGTIFFFNATADREWGDFPLSPSFVPVLRQMELYASGFSGTPVQFVTGESVSRPSWMPGRESVEILLPDGSSVAAPPNDALLLERVELPGIHTARTQGVEYWFAANPPPVESDLTPMEADALRQLVDARLIQTSAELSLWMESGQTTKPLWPLLLLFAFFLFFIEWIVANHFAARRNSALREPKERTVWKT